MRPLHPVVPQVKSLLILGRDLFKRRLIVTSSIRHIS
jgi:hypothetical protein